MIGKWLGRGYLGSNVLQRSHVRCRQQASLSGGAGREGCAIGVRVVRLWGLDRCSFPSARQRACNSEC